MCRAALACLHRVDSLYRDEQVIVVHVPPLRSAREHGDAPGWDLPQVTWAKGLNDASDVLGGQLRGSVPARRVSRAVSLGPCSGVANHGVSGNGREVPWQ